MKHHEFMVNRDNCGYNKWVVKYQNAIVNYSLNEVVVLETVKKDYLCQITISRILLMG